MRKKRYDRTVNVLLLLARKAIVEALKHKTVDVPESVRLGREFSREAGVFVTLLKHGKLRGSMGYCEGIYPLVDGVIRAARDAAFNDPRFKPVRRKELTDMRIRIDVLSAFEKATPKKLRSGDGVYVEYGPFKGLLLPEDTAGWTAKEMMQNAMRKAALAPEMWNGKNLKIYRFTAQVLEEL